MLADYVLALLKSDIPNDRIREQMLENLPDFLRERKHPRRWRMSEELPCMLSAALRHRQVR